MKNFTYQRIPDSEYQEAVSEFKRAAGKLLSHVFNMHGYRDYVPSVTNELTRLAEELSMKIRGKPIEIKLSRDWERYNADD